MRIRTIAGLAFAGVAAAAAAVGGAAYAGGDGQTASVVWIVTEDASVRTVTQDDGVGGSTAGWDCPEKGGAGQGESGAGAHAGAAGRSAGVAVTATRLVDVQAGENAGLDHATAARLLEQILSRSSG